MNGPATAGPPHLSPVEFVKSLPARFKGAVFEELLRELAAENSGQGVVPLRTAYGEWLGNLVLPDQPAARADREFFELAPEMRQALMQPYIDLDLDDTLSDEEVDAILKGLPRPQSR